MEIFAAMFSHKFVLGQAPENSAHLWLQMNPARTPGRKKAFGKSHPNDIKDGKHGPVDCVGGAW